MSRNGPAPSDPSDRSPRQTRDRCFGKRSMENAAKTIRSYDNRLTRCVHWYDERQIERVDADPDTIKRYYDKVDHHRKMKERQRSTLRT